MGYFKGASILRQNKNNLMTIRRANIEAMENILKNTGRFFSDKAENRYDSNHY